MVEQIPDSNKGAGVLDSLGYKELDSLALDIEGIAKAAGEVHVIFNNNFEDQGVRNGRSIMQKLATAI